MAEAHLLVSELALTRPKLGLQVQYRPPQFACDDLQICEVVLSQMIYKVFSNAFNVYGSRRSQLLPSFLRHADVHDVSFATFSLDQATASHPRKLMGQPCLIPFKEGLKISLAATAIFSLI